MTKTVTEVRDDIPFLDTGTIYFDNAATTPTPEPVLDAMLEYFQEYNANIGRGLYRAAKRATEAFESSRGKIAKTIGANENEIAYAKNTTEAINILAEGLDLGKGDKVIATGIDHHSNLIPWQRLVEEKGINFELVYPDENKILDPNKIEKAIDENTKLITMPHISNAFGTKQPAKEVGKIADEHDILFSLDSAQAVGHMKIDVKELGCEFLTSPGHKGLLGPQGTGFLYIREDYLEEIDPVLYGGGIVTDYRRGEFELVDPPQIFDAGTPNIPGIIGLGRAAEYVLEIGLERIEKRETKLVESLLEIKDIEKVEVYGPNSSQELGGVVAFSIDGMEHHEVSSILDETANIATRSGHHCAIPSMNYFGIDGTVRASFHYYNTEDEVQKFIKVIKELVEDLL